MTWRAKLARLLPVVILPIGTPFNGPTGETIRHMWSTALTTSRRPAESRSGGLCAALQMVALAKQCGGGRDDGGGGDDGSSGGGEGVSPLRAAVICDEIVHASEAL